MPAVVMLLIALGIGTAVGCANGFLIAKAMSLNARMLIMDEPTSSLTTKSIR